MPLSGSAHPSSSARNFAIYIGEALQIFRDFKRCDESTGEPSDNQPPQVLCCVQGPDAHPLVIVPQLPDMNYRRGNVRVQKRGNLVGNVSACAAALSKACAGESQSAAVREHAGGARQRGSGRSNEPPGAFH